MPTQCKPSRHQMFLMGQGEMLRRLVAPSRLYACIGKKSIATGAVKCDLIVDKKKIAEAVWQLKFNPIKSKIFNRSKWWSPALRMRTDCSSLLDSLTQI